MANPIIGRTVCPECGFHGAHVRESEKCRYRYCPECGAAYHAKTERQRADLTAKMRPLDALPTPTPTPTGEVPPAATPAPEPTPTPTPTPTARRHRLF